MCTTHTCSERFGYNRHFKPCSTKRSQTVIKQNTYKLQCVPYRLSTKTYPFLNAFHLRNISSSIFFSSVALRLQQLVQKVRALRCYFLSYHVESWEQNLHILSVAQLLKDNKILYLKLLTLCQCCSTLIGSRQFLMTFYREL